MGVTNEPPDLLPGTLDLLILKTLSVGTLHGYGIAQHIKRLSGDSLHVEEGSLYPTLQRMKTKWGSCNHWMGHIRLNTELVKKPRHLLEFVVVHEMVHLIEPTHSERFVSLVSEHYPAWREARAELNELPLASEGWNLQT